jgi:hypothetical protein
MPQAKMPLLVISFSNLFFIQPVANDPSPDAHVANDI